LWERAVALVERNDFRDAMPVLYRCALMGDRRAQSTLGIRYQNGEGVKADDRTAAYWFGLAAAQGHRSAQSSLGDMYHEGVGGLPKDGAKATELYIKSANQGFDRAQMSLGIAYEVGQYVPRSRPKAIALLRQSGDFGSSIADVLADPRTPARFANEDALGNYFASLRDAQIAAAWAQAHPWNSGSCGLFCQINRKEEEVKQRKEAVRGIGGPIP
jgi:TPR repeat protein